MYRDQKGQFRWTGYDSNGEAVADSNEGYVNLDYTVSAAESLFPDVQVDVEIDTPGEDV